MADTNLLRSQAILRMPVDYVDATLILHDGERSDVIFFVPPNEDIARVISEGNAFVPVMRNAKICLVARASIACIGVVVKAATSRDEGDLPTEQQHVTVKLCSGMMMEGELRWTSVTGGKRTADHLNSSASYFELRAADKAYYVMKAHVATVQEV
ncbi:MAG: hypothetical protein M3680_29545 [Myxococcota bacterium]|nr:hypothetical protein [Myxococcota bacterium]